MKDQFIETYERYIQRDGAAALLDWLKGTDFFTAPASTRFHGSHEGGLVEHSVNVWNEMCRLMRVYKSEVPDTTTETVALVTLLHDLCKVGCYKTEMRKTKVNGVWVQKPFFTFLEDFPYGGHGSKSVFLIERFMRLSEAEAVAINCHMGFSEAGANVGAIGNAFERYPLAWLLHVADEAATYIMEKKQIEP